MVNNQGWLDPSPLCGGELRVVVEEQYLALEPRVKCEAQASIEVRV